MLLESDHLFNFNTTSDELGCRAIHMNVIYTTSSKQKLILSELILKTPTEDKPKLHEIMKCYNELIRPLIIATEDLRKIIYWLCNV